MRKRIRAAVIAMLALLAQGTATAADGERTMFSPLEFVSVGSFKLHLGGAIKQWKELDDARRASPQFEIEVDTFGHVKPPKIVMGLLFLCDSQFSLNRWKRFQNQNERDQIRAEMIAMIEEFSFDWVSYLNSFGVNLDLALAKLECDEEPMVRVAQKLSEFSSKLKKRPSYKQILLSFPTKVGESKTNVVPADEGIKYEVLTLEGFGSRS